MATDLVIALKLDGLNPALQGLNMVAMRLNTLPSQAQRIASRQMGPFQRLQNAQLAHQRALQNGNAMQIADARVQAIKAQQSADRAKRVLAGGPSFADRFSTFARSTRFGGGGAMGGMNPLIGRGLDLFGAGKLAGPAMAAGLALGGLAAATNVALTAMREVGVLKFQSGGSLNDAARARQIGSFLGIDMGSFADSLASRLAQDPFAMGAGARFGISDPMGNVPGYGKLNRMENVFKTIEAIISMPEAQAIRFARQTGAEELLPLRNVSPVLIKQYQDTMKDMFSPDRVQAAFEFDMHMAKLRDSFQKMTFAMTPAVKILSTFADTVADWMNDPWWKKLAKMGGWKFAEDQEGWGKREKQKTAMEKHTDAMDRHTTAMRGIIGGGNRARNAMPGGFSGAYAQMNRVWEGEARALGAFTV